jgi:hypothetical protein
VVDINDIDCREIELTWPTQRGARCAQSCGDVDGGRADVCADFKNRCDVRSTYEGEDRSSITRVDSPGLVGDSQRRDSRGENLPLRIVVYLREHRGQGVLINVSECGHITLYCWDSTQPHVVTVDESG